MNIIKTIDVIIDQERKEIRFYNLFALVVIICFCSLLSYNLIKDNFKDIPTSLINFLTLCVGYIPVQEIVKRKKKISYLDKIVRNKVSESHSDSAEYINMIRTTILTSIK